MKNHQIFACLVLTLFFVAFRPVRSSAQIDMGALFLQSPIQKTCYSASETVTIRIKNYSSSAHNFVTAPVTVNTSTTGPNATTFPPVVINTGSLPAGDSLSVLITGSYNMSAGGNYTFNASTSVSGDGNAANNSMSATAISVAPLVAGTIT